MVIGSLITGAAVGYMLFILPTLWLKIEKVRVPLGLNQKILQISDLHVERLRISPATLQRVIRQEQPDLIVLTGDFTKKMKHLWRLDTYLHVFRRSGCPVYAVLGNHDYLLPAVDVLVKKLENGGVHVLRNASVRMKGFQLIGIDDYYTGHSDIELSWANVNHSLPKIIITHDPNVLLEIRRPFDYLMAGHFHGKQINIPFLFKLKPMGKLPTLGIYKGRHRNKHGTFFISKGIGQSGLNVRLFVRSEVTVHEL